MLHKTRLKLNSAKGLLKEMHEVGLEAPISLCLNYNVFRIYCGTDCYLVSIMLAGKDMNSMTLLAMHKHHYHMITCVSGDVSTSYPQFDN